jgi:hypothetical protein
MSASKKSETPSLRERLAPLRSFLDEVEASGKARLTGDEFDYLQGTIENAAPRLAGRVYWVQSAAWLVIGMFVARYALGA